MVKKVIGIGNSPNDGTGDDLRTSFDKINDNFTELFDASSATSNLDFSSNSLVSTNTNGQIILDPNGTGDIVLSADTSVTGTLITTGAATFASSVIISGNLTVDGGTTSIESVTLQIDDPLISLNSSFTGASTIDAGLVIERGTNINIAFIWDDSAGEFATINTTETGITVGNVTIDSYANLHVFDLTTEGTFNPLSITTGDIEIAGGGGSGTIRNIVTNNDLNLTANGTGQVVLVSELNMSSNAVRNVADPVTTADAMPQTFADARYLQISAGSVTGPFTIDQITIEGLNITTNQTNASLTLNPSGTGDVIIVSGNLELGAGDLTTTGNVNITNIISTGSITGTLGTAAQPNITSIGPVTLSGDLALGGNAITGVGNIAGTLTTAAQTNITSVGTLTSLTSSGDIAGPQLAWQGNQFVSLLTNADIVIQPAGTGAIELIATVNVTGNMIATGSLGGTLTTVAQPNVTSLGALTTLTVDQINLNNSTIITTSGPLTISPNASEAVELLADTNITGELSVTAGSLLSGLVRNGITNVITAAGSTQGTATALTTQINRVTVVVAVTDDGVQLPDALSGVEILIINDDSADALAIWPATGDDIDGGATDAEDASPLAAGSARRYIAVDGTSWFTA